MSSFSSVLARILLRYLAAALVARGLVTADLGAMLAGDGDVVAALTALSGLLIAVAVEGWYVIARRLGWAT